jgi:hypothetical protein
VCHNVLNCSFGLYQLHTYYKISLFCTDLVSLFTNIPISEALQDIRTNLALMRCFQIGHLCRLRILWNYYRSVLKPPTSGWKIGFINKRVVWSWEVLFLQLSVTFLWNILKKLALNSVSFKPAMWLRHVDNTFVVWSLGMEKQ